MKTSFVVGSAAGYSTKSMHVHWCDVSPIRMRKTAEDRGLELKAFNDLRKKERARQRDIASKGGKLLPSLY